MKGRMFEDLIFLEGEYIGGIRFAKMVEAISCIPLYRQLKISPFYNPHVSMLCLSLPLEHGVIEASIAITPDVIDAFLNSQKEALMIIGQGVISLADQICSCRSQNAEPFSYVDAQLSVAQYYYELKCPQQKTTLGDRLSAGLIERDKSRKDATLSTVKGFLEGDPRYALIYRGSLADFCVKGVMENHHVSKLVMLLLNKFAQSVILLQVTSCAPVALLFSVRIGNEWLRIPCPVDESRLTNSGVSELVDDITKQVVNSIVVALLQPNLLTLKQEGR